MPDDTGAFDTDEAIRDSYARVRRQDQLIRQRHALDDLLEAVQERVTEFERRFEVEQKDVERLERGGFARLVADLAGGRDTKLAMERVEAEAAYQKLEGERARVTHVKAQLDTVRAELGALGDARDRYDYAIKRKSRDLSEGGDPRGTELAELHDRFVAADMDLREYTEAHQSGIDAGELLVRMHEHLGHAAGQSVTDTFGNFVSPFADYYKHKHLSAADELAWETQKALDLFSRELADVGVTASVQLPKVGTRWFADMFIDNIVTDWARFRRIKQTLVEVDQITRWVAAMVQWLQDRSVELTTARDDLVSRRDELLAP